MVEAWLGPFRRDSRVWRTDRRIDRQTDKQIFCLRLLHYVTRSTGSVWSSLLALSIITENAHIVAVIPAELQSPWAPNYWFYHVLQLSLESRVFVWRTHCRISATLKALSVRESMQLVTKSMPLIACIAGPKIGGKDTVRGKLGRWSLIGTEVWGLTPEKNKSNLCMLMFIVKTQLL